MSEVTWPQAHAASAALTAYQTALDWTRRLPHDEIVKRCEEKIAEKRAVIDQWGKQHDRRT